MNSRLELLKPYPFERLNILLKDANPDPAQNQIRWSIGEPKFPPPEFVLEMLASNLNSFGKYPTTKGILELREAISNWLVRRFSIKPDSLDPEKNILPVAGTREALFSISQVLVEAKNEPYVVSPNPFYQIYEGATYLSGANPHFINLKEENGFNPEFTEVPDSIWQKTSLAYICSPSNPTGSTMSMEEWSKLIELSQKFDFVICADECYSEIYKDESNPPVGLLEAAHRQGLKDFNNCLAFHSLSKRSNLPGLRSGFVAGDSSILKKYLLFRTYHGCTLAPPIQVASTAAWKDEDHVKANREGYRQNFEAVINILDPGGKQGLKQPDGAFYLWFKTPYNEEKFAYDLFNKEHLHVLPGSYLSREVDGINPGAMRVRMALVATKEECIEGAKRLKQILSA